MTMAQVTEEQIENAARAIYDCEGDSANDTWDMCRPGCRKYARAALESVADDLRAEGMEAAIQICAGDTGYGSHGEMDYGPTVVGRLLRRLRARANQLSPTSKGDGE
jgi:hypothetical protein